MYDPNCAIFDDKNEDENKDNSGNIKENKENGNEIMQFTSKYVENLIESFIREDNCVPNLEDTSDIFEKVMKTKKLKI